MISTSATNPGRWPSLAIAATLVMLGQGNALAQDQTQQSTLRQQALTEHNNKRPLLQSTPALTLARRLIRSTPAQKTGRTIWLRSALFSTVPAAALMVRTYRSPTIQTT